MVKKSRKIVNSIKQLNPNSDIEYGNDKTFQQMQGEGPA